MAMFLTAARQQASQLPLPLPLPLPSLPSPPLPPPPLLFPVAVSLTEDPPVPRPLYHPANPFQAPPPPSSLYWFPPPPGGDETALPPTICRAIVYPKPSSTPWPTSNPASPSTSPTPARWNAGTMRGLAGKPSNATACAFGGSILCSSSSPSWSLSSSCSSWFCPRQPWPS